MTSLMSMEDLFYGPREPTWIFPTPNDPSRRYRERDDIVEPHPRLYKPAELRPVVRYEPRPVVNDIRPIERPVADDIRPIERLAHVRTAPEPVPVRAHEEIRKVVEVPVPVPVPVATPVVPVTERRVEPAPDVVVRRQIAPIQRPLYQPIELKVPMCCEKCAKKVKDRLEELQGVESVVTDQYNQKVIVHGNVDPTRVLNRVKLVKKRSAFWDMTVDYSQQYRRHLQAQADAGKAEAARANAARAEAVAKAETAKVVQAKALAASPQVVVKLPQDANGPKVTAILPAEKENVMPYAANSRVHSQRYVSPPKAYRQEMYYGPPEHQYRGEYYDMPNALQEDMRRPEFYNRRHQDSYTGY